MTGLCHNKRSLTRRDALRITRFLMACYHEGVCDAWKANDDTYCHQYMSRQKRELSYGILDTPAMNANTYLFTLLLYCRSYRMPDFGRGVIMNMTRNSPLLDLCERFYVQGINDYVDNPDYLHMDEFKDEPNSLWGGRYKEAPCDYVVRTVQNFCLEIKEGYEKLGRAERGAEISKFGYTLWLLTRPVGYGLRK